MDKLKIGIIGCGGISRMHISSYLKNPDVELYALCDINEERLKKAADEYGITRTFTNKEDMLALPEIDAVSVCTWNSEHMPCTIAALNAGKHVLCEKPMSINSECAEKMKEAADKNGKILMIGFVRRFGHDMQLLEDFGKQDYMGEIYYANARYLRRKGNPGGWFGDKARSGGGPLIDLGVHMIDFVKYSMGNPKPISVYCVTYQKLFERSNIKTSAGYVSMTEASKKKCDVEDFASLMLRFDNGATMHLETSFSLNIEKETNEIELFGTKAGVKLGDKMKFITEENGYLANVEIETDASMDFGGAFSREINNFVDTIFGRAECKNPAEDGVEMMKILDAAYESARTGHEVIIK